MGELVISEKTATPLKSNVGNPYHPDPQAQGFVNKASGRYNRLATV